jgi:TetR/AcrR family transcriptional regulator, regulator of cefoperazone and chloramphenicol sensitivity
METQVTQSTKTTTSEAPARLLQAARKLFAEKGVAATSIRELAQEAGVNVAAVNYHFGDKERLYLEALRYCYRASAGVLNERGNQILQQAIGEGTQQAAATGIRDYIRELMHALFFSEDARLQAKLMFREMSDPTPALEVIVREFVVPKRELLCKLIAQANPDLGHDKNLRLYAASIMGQVLYYRTSLPVFLRLFEINEMTPELAEQIANHIADFTLAALTNDRYQSDKHSHLKERENENA